MAESVGVDAGLALDRALGAGVKIGRLSDDRRPRVSVELEKPDIVCFCGQIAKRRSSSEPHRGFGHHAGVPVRVLSAPTLYADLDVGLCMWGGVPVTVLVASHWSVRTRSIVCRPDTGECDEGYKDPTTGWVGSPEQIHQYAKLCRQGKCPAPQYHCDAAAMLRAIDLSIRVKSWMPPVGLMSPASAVESFRSALIRLALDLYHQTARQDIPLLFETVFPGRYACLPAWARSRAHYQLHELMHVLVTSRKRPVPHQLLDVCEQFVNAWDREAAVMSAAAAIYKARREMADMEPQFVVRYWDRPCSLKPDDWDLVHRVLSWTEFSLARIVQLWNVEPDIEQWPMWLRPQDRVSGLESEKFADHLRQIREDLISRPSHMWAYRRCLGELRECLPDHPECRLEMAGILREWRRRAKAVMQAYTESVALQNQDARRQLLVMRLRAAGFRKKDADEGALYLSMAPPPDSPASAMQQLAAAFG